MEVNFQTDKVFSEDYLYFYTPLSKRTKKEVDFIEDVLELNKSRTFLQGKKERDKKKKILDLACGHGRHAITLAKRGYKVAGFDQSQLFLDKARKKAKNLNVKFIQGDMRNILLKDKFDCVYNFFTSFGYFSDKDNLKVIKQVYKLLKPKGKFLLDIINREFILRNYRPYTVVEKEGNLMIDSIHFDVFTSRNNVRRVIVRGSKKRKFTFFVRLYSYTEIKEIFKKVGFRILKSFGGIDYQEYSLDSSRMIILAEKV